MDGQYWLHPLYGAVASATYRKNIYTLRLLSSQIRLIERHRFVRYASSYISYVLTAISLVQKSCLRSQLKVFPKIIPRIGENQGPEKLIDFFRLYLLYSLLFFNIRMIIITDTSPNTSYVLFMRGLKGSRNEKYSTCSIHHGWMDAWRLFSLNRAVTSATSNGNGWILLNPFNLAAPVGGDATQRERREGVETGERGNHRSKWMDG